MSSVKSSSGINSSLWPRKDWSCFSDFKQCVKDNDKKNKLTNKYKVFWNINIKTSTQQQAIMWFILSLSHLIMAAFENTEAANQSSHACVFYFIPRLCHRFYCWHVCVSLGPLWKVSAHFMAAWGSLSTSVCEDEFHAHQQPESSEFLP